MDTAESWFVQQFIVRHKRERVLYELAHPDKRRMCLWNMTSAGNDRLNDQKVRVTSLTCEEMLVELRTAGIGGKAIASIISGQSELDGQLLPVKEALLQAWHHWPYVLILHEAGVALIAGESGANAPWRAILK